MTSVTQHAERRCQQRGLPFAVVDLVLQYADRETNVGENCTALEISRDLLDGLRSCAPETERARDVIVILNSQSEIVTVLKARDSKAARVYRKGLQ